MLGTRAAPAVRDPPRDWSSSSGSNHCSAISSSEINGSEINDSALRSSSVGKQFISSGVGAPDQVTPPLPITALFSSSQCPAPRRCALAKQRVVASRTVRRRVPLRVVPALNSPAPELTLQSGALDEPDTARRRRNRALRTRCSATDRPDRTRSLPAAGTDLATGGALTAESPARNPSGVPESGVHDSGVHGAPAARRRQHRQLLQGDTTRNHRDGSWRHALH